MEEPVQALQERLERVEQERDALEQRVQNLETIVTSETWNVLHDSTTDPSSLSEEPEPVDLQFPADSTDRTSTQEQIEKLAHTVFGRERVFSRQSTVEGIGFLNSGAYVV